MAERIIKLHHPMKNIRAGTLEKHTEILTTLTCIDNQKIRNTEEKIKENDGPSDNSSDQWRTKMWAGVGSCTPASQGSSIFLLLY